MTRPRPSAGPFTGAGGDGVLTTIGLALAAGVFTVGVGVWAAAQLAALISHRTVLPISLSVGVSALPALPRTWDHPDRAFPSAAHKGFAPPMVFYLVLLALLGVGVAAGIWLAGCWSRWQTDSRRRTRDRSSSWATARDVAVLRVSGSVGDRVALGRLERIPLAAEARRSVLLVAPTQAGKTSRFVVPTVLRWTGPIVVTSVKPDVLQLTYAARATQGGAMVFDPAGTLPQDGPIRTCWWTPLLGADSYPVAERTAGWLVEASIPAGTSGGMEHARFWESLATKLLGVLLFAAAHADSSLHTVASWVDRRDVDEVSSLLEFAGDPDALDAWAASCAREPRQRDSVYATVETLLAPFANANTRQAVTVDKHRPRIDINRLLDDNAALYLVAPEHDQVRLRPLFEALLHSVIRAAQDRHAATGRALDPAMLLMLDEAAHIAPLRTLPTLAATGAGQGIQICSVWQDLAQIEQIYGRGARSLINNHTARVFLPGNGDVTTLDELSRLLADHETQRESVTTTKDGTGTSRNRSSTDERLAPLDYLRQLPADSALVLYGRLPPIRVTTRGYWQQPDLVRLISRPTPTPAAAPPNEPAAADGVVPAQGNGPQPGYSQSEAVPIAQPADSGRTGPFITQEAPMPIPSNPPGPDLLSELDLVPGELNRAVHPGSGRYYTLATALDGTRIPIPESMTEAERAELDALHDAYQRRLLQRAAGQLTLGLKDPGLTLEADNDEDTGRDGNPGGGVSA
jgi:type IV secretion system protein VirD4